MSLRPDPKTALIRRLSLFEACTAAEVREIAAIADEIQLRAGVRLITEGERGQEFVVILSGSADVFKQDDLVATLGPDSFVGEISLLTGEARTATVVARTDVRLLVITAHRFATLLDRMPGLRTKIEAVVPGRRG